LAADGTSSTSMIDDDFRMGVLDDSCDEKGEDDDDDKGGDDEKDKEKKKKARTTYATHNMPPPPAHEDTIHEDDKHCVHCDEVPCLLDQGLYVSITEFESGLRDADHDEQLSNKQVRYQLYRHATTWIHGYLGRGKRIELPQCVRTEILDLAPESDRSYVGFTNGDC
jgi:hypothetical protein